ncbi:hypothetical protein PIB30_059580, partial [Stylosanthes scabra]|nr:hypothetical protein [Stylosanthes scabra]
TNSCMDNIENSLRDMQGMLKEALQLKTLEHDPEGEGSNYTIRTSWGNSSGQPLTRPHKIELPIFDGEKVEEWLAFHLLGPAYSWYRWSVKNNITYTWESFLKELKQMINVSDYQGQFEDLSNQIG